MIQNVEMVPLGMIGRLDNELVNRARGFSAHRVPRTNASCANFARCNTQADHLLLKAYYLATSEKF